MQLKTLFPLAFAAAVFADGAAIQAALAKVSAAAVVLNDTVSSFPSSPVNVDTLPGVGDLLVDSTTLLSDINAATKVAQQSANLTVAETLAVAGSAQTLVSDVQTTLANVVAAKAKFDKLLIVSPVLLLNLKLEKDASDKLNAAVIAKVPAALQSTATSITAPIDTAFNEAITAYE